MEEVSGLLWVSQSCKNQQNVIIRQRSDIFWHETMLSGRQRTIDNNVCELKVGIFLLHLWWKIQVTVSLIKIVHVFASSKPWRFLVLPLCYEIMIFNINAFCISHATTRLFIATRYAKLPNFLYPSLLSFSSLIIDSMFNISHFFCLNIEVILVLIWSLSSQIYKDWNRRCRWRPCRTKFSAALPTCCLRTIAVSPISYPRFSCVCQPCEPSAPAIWSWQQYHVTPWWCRHHRTRQPWQWDCSEVERGRN